LEDVTNKRKPDIRVGDLATITHDGIERRGAVTAVWATGTLQVTWDEVGAELPRHWPAEFVRLLSFESVVVAKPARCGRSNHKVGDRVYLSYDGDQHVGTVTKVRQDNTFRILWDAGAKGPPTKQYRRWTAQDLRVLRRG